MSHLENYKSLIIDCITFLKDLDKRYIETEDQFFKKDIISPKKINTNAQFNQKRKPNIEVPNIVIEKPAQKEETIIKKAPLPPIEKKPQVRIETKKEAPIKTEKKKDIKKIERFEKPQLIDDSFSEILKTISKVAPSLEIIDSIDDQKAKKIASKYKLKNEAAEITLLAYKESESAYKFLQKLSIALEVYFLPTKVVSAYKFEKENSWDSFFEENDIKLIISSDYTVFELEKLKKYYVEVPAKREKFLNKVPLFLLPDLSLYLKEPMLKNSLFKTLKQQIENLNE